MSQSKNSNQLNGVLCLGGRGQPTWRHFRFDGEPKSGSFRVATALLVLLVKPDGGDILGKASFLKPVGMASCRRRYPAEIKRLEAEHK